MRISIDDFGTGYSSLSRLSDFPIDVLKLDRSFLTGLDSNPRRLILIDSMVELCQKLDIEVVVEGVETAAELSLLQSFKSLCYQGCFFSLPLSLSRVSRLLNQIDEDSHIHFPIEENKLLTAEYE